MNDLLIDQLTIPWSLATEHVLPRIDEDLVHWRPSQNAVMVRQVDGRWVADWPDEESEPLPDLTAGWLLWHIEWWWTNALNGVQGRDALPPDAVDWSGSADASRRRLAQLHDQWMQALRSTDGDQAGRGWPWPTAQPLSRIGAWVNVELMKNVAELGQLVHLRANCAD